jgi:hypothetical protein
MSVRKIPTSASIATEIDNSAKLHAPSASRNANEVCATLKSIAPISGNALEIASGTGQHVVVFAAAMPFLTWQPTEIDRGRRASIQAYIDDTTLGNITAPIFLNATVRDWSKDVPPKDLIYLCNLLHLVSLSEAEVLIKEAAKTLLPSGKLFLYGPFKREGKLTSEGDRSFDASIRATDPDTGYKDDIWVKLIATQNGLTLGQAIEMPANNLALVFNKSP